MELSCVYHTDTDTEYRIWPLSNLVLQTIQMLMFSKHLVNALIGENKNISNVYQRR